MIAAAARIYMVDFLREISAGHQNARRFEEFAYHHRQGIFVSAHGLRLSRIVADRSPGSAYRIVTVDDSRFLNQSERNMFVHHLLNDPTADHIAASKENLNDYSTNRGDRVRLHSPR